jgi:hypothetical protein
MQLDGASLRRMVGDSITAPRMAARQLLQIGGGYGLALLAVACVAVLSALFSVLLSRISPATGNPDMDYLMTQPLLLAALQAIGMVIFAMLVTGIGRLFGGTGRLEQILLVFAWLDFLLLVVQMGLLLLMLALPALGGLMFLGVMVLVTWLLASFVAEVHGFRSTFATAAAMIGTLMLVGMGLVLIFPPM